MPTSGSTDYTTNRDSIITGALRLIGAVAQGETPTASQISEGAEALNFMVKAWSVDGMPLWAIKEYSLQPVVATRVYRIGLTQTVNIPKPIRITSAYFHDSVSNVDVPMILMTRDEYNSLGNKTSTGQPIQFYYDVQNVYGDLYVFPVPDDTAATTGNYIRLVYQRPYEDFDAASDEPDFPQEWFDALKFGLADRLCAEYGVPIVDRNDLRSRAAQLKTDALSAGTEEGSFFFMADRRDY